MFNLKRIKKMLKKIIFGITIIGAIVGAYGLYVFFMPHRDVQSVEAFATISANDLVVEYLKDNAAANMKYLADDGDSKVLNVTGRVNLIDTDQKNQMVVVLKDEGAGIGVSCTFMESTNKNAEQLEIGDQVKIKGVLRSGVDEDSEMLEEDVIIENCDIVK